MNIDPRRVDIVRQVIPEVVAAGNADFRPGHVASIQRERNDPIPVWELRAIFVMLQAEGFLQLDDSTGNWSLSPEAQAAAG